MERKSAKTTYNEKRYPGSAVDASDSDTVTHKLEKQYTRQLNNNPRNSET